MNSLCEECNKPLSSIDTMLVKPEGFRTICGDCVRTACARFGGNADKMVEWFKGAIPLPEGKNDGVHQSA